MSEVVQGVEVASSSCADEKSAFFAVTWANSKKTNHGDGQLQAIHPHTALVAVPIGVGALAKIGTFDGTMKPCEVVYG